RRAERELARLDLALDALQARDDGVALGGAQDTDLGEHRGVRLGPGDVLGVQALVEGDRGVNLLHERRRTAPEVTAPQSDGAGRRLARRLGHGRFRTTRAGTMKSCLLRLAALAALIIPLPAAAFNFAPSEPKPVPALTFRDGAGKEVSLADFAGEVVVLNLWATWCAPCRDEMPSLDRLQARFGGNGLEVVALSLDRGDVAKVRDFYDELGISSLAIYHDPDSRAGRELGAPGLPTTIVIDRSGREVGRLLGPAEWDSDEAIAVIEQLVGSGNSEAPQES